MSIILYRYTIYHTEYANAQPKQKRSQEHEERDKKGRWGVF